MLRLCGQLFPLADVEASAHLAAQNRIAVDDVGDAPRLIERQRAAWDTRGWPSRSHRQRAPDGDPESATSAPRTAGSVGGGGSSSSAARARFGEIIAQFTLPCFPMLNNVDEITTHSDAIGWRKVAAASNALFHERGRAEWVRRRQVDVAMLRREA